MSVIGASNELPEGEELDALFDRFLLRLHVGPVSKAGFRALLALRGDARPDIPEGLRLGADVLAAVQEHCLRVEVPEDVGEMLAQLRQFLREQDIFVSDRRWRKVVRLLQVSALTNGRMAVSIWDCWLLQHCLWERPEEREKIYQWYAGRVGATRAMDPGKLTKVVVAWETKLKRAQEDRSQMRDKKGRLLYVGADGKYVTQTEGDFYAVTQQNEPLYLAHPNMRQSDRTNSGKGYTQEQIDEWFQHHSSFYGRNWQGRDAYYAEPNSRLTVRKQFPAAMEPTRHAPAYVRDCLAQIKAVADEVGAYLVRLGQHIASLTDTIRSHLWVDGEFVEPATASLQATQSEANRLRGRIDQVRAGFERLPLQEDIGGDEDPSAVEGAPPAPAPTAPPRAQPSKAPMRVR